MNYTLKSNQSVARDSYGDSSDASAENREIELIVSELRVPGDVRERALSILKQASGTGLVKNSKLQCFAAASLYIACRQEGIAVSFRELSRIGRVKKWRDIYKTYVLLVDSISIAVPISDASKYVWRIASKTHKSDQSVNLATQIIVKAKIHKVAKRTIIGKDPMSVAAAALYAACSQLGEKATQKEMAEAAGLSELSVRKAFGALREELKLIVSGGRAKLSTVPGTE